MNKFAVINFFLFQLVWFTCALLTEHASWFLLPLIALHFALFKQRTRDFKLLPIASVGIAFDFLMFKLGILTFNESFFPAWLCLLWMMFVLSLNYSFDWMNKLNVFVNALIGGIFGPLSYFAAVKFGALGMGVAQTQFLFIYALGWALIMPLLIYLNNRPYYKLS